MKYKGILDDGMEVEGEVREVRDLMRLIESVGGEGSEIEVRDDVVVLKGVECGFEIMRE